ncbi:MAG: metal-dependent transcriptional regulator [Chloroflexi bacterium]|nr:metal-dependent transcriptional regulator [Chloroflexota bacterium]
MTDQLSSNIQDYLKRIYEITSGGGLATTNQLASVLKVSPASVTNMVQKLATTRPSYLVYYKHKGVQLTEAGRLAALKIIRRHRLIEHYLMDALGYTWDEVHQEAEILEHAMSPLLESRIDAALGHPEFNPHGNPIPNSNLSVPEIEQISLNAIDVNQTAVILSVPHEDPKVLRYLDKFGLRPNVQIKLLSRTPYDQTMRVQITATGEEVIIGPTLAEEIALLIEE